MTTLQKAERVILVIAYTLVVGWLGYYFGQPSPLKFYDACHAGTSAIRRAYTEAARAATEDDSLFVEAMDWYDDNLAGAGGRACERYSP